MKYSRKNDCRLNRRFLGFLAAAALAFPGVASAACPPYGDRQFSFAGTIKIVANAADVGEALTPWLDSNEVVTTYCANMGSWSHINKFRATRPEVGSYIEGGSTYSVFPTGIDGIGMIIRIRPSILWNDDAYPIRAGVEVSANIGYGTVDDVLDIIQITRIRFIKTGPTTPQSADLSGLVLLNMVHHQNSDRWSHNQSMAPTIIEVQHRPLCHVTPKTVPLGLAALTSLPSQWSFGPTRSFTVDLSCETGAGRVNYYIEPTGATSAVDVDRGVVDVQGAAKGVGVQLLQADGSQIKLGRSYPFGSSAADGARSETFGARFIRTAASAGDTEPGDASATVRFRIDYP
ncbi:fimbrial protein [Stenotrophomonas maltophilia]|nr:fimbrial protein [Stenotrophomonas maltophilia]MBN4965105.1 fimbrial protein [Stenotrophomonas maltophilia]